MNAQEKAVAWKKIETMCKNIIDPILRNSILGELSARAEKEWGYCPASEKFDNKLVLEDWEQDLIDSIKISEQYGVLLLKDREYSEQIHKENQKWMLDFIRRGGEYTDLPQEMRNGYTLGIYNHALLMYGEEIDEKTKHLF